MTPRERLLAVLRREELYPVPLEFGTTPAFADRLAARIGTRDFAGYFQFEMRGVGWGPPKERSDFSEYLEGRNLPEKIHVGEWGEASVPGTFYHFTRKVHLLDRVQTLEELERYPFPNVADPDRHAHLEGAVAALHEQGLAAVGGMECTIFELAWYLRSMEQLFVDHVERPEMAAYLLDQITERKVFMARRYAEAGVDIIRFGDDIGTQRGPLLSLAMWRQWYKPRLAQVIAAAKSAKPDLIAFYHSDGNVEAFVPELIEIGVDVLNPVQPECMDPARLKEQYGKRLSFWGTIGTQTTMPFGTPEEVRAVVRKRIETVGRGGGLVLAPTHVLEPDVPVENLLAFVDEARRYRRRA